MTIELLLLFHGLLNDEGSPVEEAGGVMTGLFAPRACESAVAKIFNSTNKTRTEVVLIFLICFILKFPRAGHLYELNGRFEGKH